MSSSLGLLTRAGAIVALALILPTSAFATEERGGATATSGKAAAPGEEPAAMEGGGAPDESAAATEAAAPEAAPPDVERAIVTLGVEDREPTQPVSELANDQDRVLFFTDLRHLAGQTVTHRWEWNDQVMAAVPFEVGGDRWRVWSSKNLEPSWLGDWTVSVVAEDGTVLASETFSYTKAPEASESAEATEPAEPAQAPAAPAPEAPASENDDPAE
jgi:hypothetical protein